MINILMKKQRIIARCVYDFIIAGVRSGFISTTVIAITHQRNNYYLKNISQKYNVSVINLNRS